MKSLNKYLWISAIVISSNFSLLAQSETINLWSKTIPGAITNKDYQEIEVIKDGELSGTSKVVQPTLLFAQEVDMDIWLSIRKVLKLLNG